MPPGGIILSRTRRANPEQPSNGPEPTWAEDFSANARLFLDDMTYVQRERRDAAYADIVDRLRERKVAEADEWFTLTNEAGLLPVVGPWQDHWDGAKIWEVVQRERQAAIRRGEKDPYADLPATREEFEKQVETRERAVERGLVSTGGSTRRLDQGTVARSSRVTPGLAAGLVTSFADPLNLATLPVGAGSKTVAQAAIRNAIINMGIEAVQLPGVAAQRERMDETLSGDEALLRIGSAAAFGAFLGGGGKILADNWAGIKGAPAAVQERVWASILDRNPGLREKVGSTIDWDALDPHLTDIAERIIPPERMTDAERGAINALRRDAATQSGNPFVPDGAGIEAHNRLLGETLQGIINDTPVYVPKTRPPASARLRGGTSIGSGVVEQGSRIASADGARGEVRGVLSGAGFNDAVTAGFLGNFEVEGGYGGARGDGGSASGIAQWRHERRANFRRLYGKEPHEATAREQAEFVVWEMNNPGAAGMTVAQRDAILAARTPEEAAELIDRFYERSSGQHRQRRMEEARRFHGGEFMPAAREGESDIAAALDREIADTQAELARLDSEIEAAARPAPDVIEDLTPDAVRVVDEPPLPRIEAPDGTRAPIATDGRAEVAGMTPEARGAIPKLKGIVERELDLSLNDTAALSARVGVDERNLRMALQQMAIDGLVIQKRNGNFARLPRAKDGPMDVLAYVASTGGVTPKGFSQSLMAIHANMANPPKGHDLGRIFAVEREVRWKRKPDPARGIEGIPLAKPRRTTRSALIPRYGPIVRNSGRGLDEIGLDLYEAGYFGPPESRPRPTENEVLELLQEAFTGGKKIYSIYDQVRAADLEAEAAMSGYADPKNPFASDFHSEEHFLFEWSHFDDAAETAFGIRLDEEAFIAAWGEYRAAGDGDVRGAVVRAVQREIEDIQAREIAERGIDDAEDIIAEWEAALRGDGILGGEEGGRPLFEPGDPGPSGPPRGPAEWEETGPLDPERWQHWDEPDGPAAKIDADSIEHDLRVQVGADAAPAPKLETLTPDGSAEEFFAAMRALPDTQASQDALAAVRSRLWAEADAQGTLDETIIRFDEARDRWDAQFEAAREAEGIARAAAMDAEQAALAKAIADHVNSGRGVMRLLNSVRNTLPEYGPGTVRVRNGQLEVVEGRNWVGVPGSSLSEIAGRMGVKLEQAPTITTAADGQADFAAPTGEQVRTALERQTEGGIRPTGEQKAPGSDGGLFDTRAPEADLFDGVAFRLDEEGDVVNPADLLAEFDEEAAFIKTIRDCL